MKFPTLLFDQDRITPEKLRDRALRAAAGLAGLGVREGDVIAIMLRNEPAAMEAILAARHLGAYWCGLNWHFKAGEARWVLEDSKACVLIVHADLLPQIAGGIPFGLQVLVVRPTPLTQQMFGLPENAWHRFRQPLLRPCRLPAHSPSGPTGCSSTRRRRGPSASPVA